MGQTVTSSGLFRCLLTLNLHFLRTIISKLHECSPALNLFFIAVMLFEFKNRTRFECLDATNYVAFDQSVNFNKSGNNKKLAIPIQIVQLKLLHKGDNADKQR